MSDDVAAEEPQLITLLVCFLIQQITLLHENLPDPVEGYWITHFIGCF
jgi:hypothetical protein